VSRIVGYFAASLFSNTLTTSILDLTHSRPDLAPVYRAMDSSAKGWGVVVGPWLAGLVGKRSLGLGPFSNTQLPFVLSGTFAACCFAWLSTSTSETLPRENRKPFKAKKKNVLGVLDLLGHGPEMNRVVAMSVVADMGSRTAPIFAVTTRTMFGWDTETTARWLLCYGLGMAIGPGIVSKYTVRKLGPRGAHYFDNVGLIIAACMLALSRKGKLFWSALVVYLFSLGFVSGAKNAQMSAATRFIPNVGRGELTGRFSSLSSVSNMLSPQLYAWVFGLFTSESAPVYYPGVPFAIAAMTNLVYFILLQGINEETFPWVSKNKTTNHGGQRPRPYERMPSGSRLSSIVQGAPKKRNLSASRLAAI